MRVAVVVAVVVRTAPSATCSCVIAENFAFIFGVVLFRGGVIIKQQNQ